MNVSKINCGALFKENTFKSTFISKYKGIKIETMQFLELNKIAVEIIWYNEASVSLTVRLFN